MRTSQTLLLFAAMSLCLTVISFVDGKSFETRLFFSVAIFLGWFGFEYWRSECSNKN